MARLSPLHREVLRRRNGLDESYGDIADGLGIGIGTVKSRILRGREALRGELAASLRPASLTPQLARHRS